MQRVTVCQAYEQACTHKTKKDSKYIKHILTCTHSYQPSHPHTHKGREKDRAQGADIRYVYVQCDNIIEVWEYENINYIIVTQDLVCNSILSLHLGRGVVSSIRMVSLVRMVSLARMVCLVRKGKVHLGPNVSSSAHYRGCIHMVNGSGAMAAI